MVAMQYMFTLFLKKLHIKRFTVYFISISQPQLGQKVDLKKPYQHLVLALFFLSNTNTCTLHHFYKAQNYNHYATIGSPWIAQCNSAHIGVVTVAQWQLFTVEYGTMHTPIQIYWQILHTVLPGWEVQLSS